MVQLDDPDCIVIGAGIVGTALAYSLANNGRNVLLFERDMNEPDRIVGELLQPGGIKALEKIGLAVKGIDAITNVGYTVIYGDKTVMLKYPKCVGSADTEWGCSFHHGKFIMNLRKACSGHKRIQIVEATVNDLISDREDPDTVIGVRATVKREVGTGEDGQPVFESQKKEYYAPLTFVADGCFSKFRKEISHNDVFVRSHFVGAILKDCPLPSPAHGHVVLAQPSPVLLYQIGTHDTRVLVDVPGKVPSASTGALKAYMLNDVMPQLPEQVQPSFKDAIETQRLRVMPNSFLPPVLNERNGLVIVGDALNMRHPLTGGGMTVAFNDVAMLSELLKDVEKLNDHEAIKKKLFEFTEKRKSHCTVINVLAQALYELFSAGDDWRMGVLRKACFAYFELGGICADHPVGLLAGLRKSPMTLYVHFFAVAFYGMIRLLTTPAKPLDQLLISDSLIKKSEDVVTVAVLSSLNVLLYILLTVLSLPLNLVYGIIVIASASKVIFPLIWSEIRV